MIRAMRALDTKLDAFLGVDIDVKLLEEIWNMYDLTEKRVLDEADSMVDLKDISEPGDDWSLRAKDFSKEIVNLKIPKTAWFYVREFAVRMSESTLRCLIDFCRKEIESTVVTYKNLYTHNACSPAKKTIAWHAVVYNSFRWRVYSRALKLLEKPDVILEITEAFKIIPPGIRKSALQEELFYDTTMHLEDPASSAPQTVDDGTKSKTDG